MPDESFVWMNADFFYDERIRSLGVHSEVFLIELASFAAGGDPPGTLTADALAECFKRHASGPDADEVDPEADLARLIDGGLVVRDGSGGVKITAPELFVYGDDPGADIHLMAAQRKRRELEAE